MVFFSKVFSIAKVRTILRGDKMSLPIILIVVVTIMGIFAFSIILLARKNSVSLKQTVDPKPLQAYKNGEQKQQ